MKETSRNQKTWAALVCIAIVLVVGFAIWTKDQGSSITVSAPPGAKVFVNGELEGQTGTLKSEVNVKKPPGGYAVIVALDGRWPWMKNVDLAVNESKMVKPFLIPRDAAKEQILEYIPEGKGKKTKENPEYKKIFERFNTIIIRPDVEKALDPLEIELVKSADFYPGRDDLLIAAAKNQIFAIETIPGEPRNFQPIFSGSNPFFILDGTNLYVKDGVSLYKIDLGSF